MKISRQVHRQIKRQKRKANLRLLIGHVDVSGRSRLHMNPKRASILRTMATLIENTQHPNPLKKQISLGKLNDMYMQGNQPHGGNKKPHNVFAIPSIALRTINT